MEFDSTQVRAPPSGLFNLGDASVPLSSARARGRGSKWLGAARRRGDGMQVLKLAWALLSCGWSSLHAATA